MAKHKYDAEYIIIYYGEIWTLWLDQLGATALYIIIPFVISIMFLSKNSILQDYIEHIINLMIYLCLTLMNYWIEL